MTTGKRSVNGDRSSQEGNTCVGRMFQAGGGASANLKGEKDEQKEGPEKNGAKKKDK